MKTTVTKASPEPAIREGKLYETKDGTIVLATADTFVGAFHGVVVHDAGAEKRGFFSPNWAAGAFKPFHGTLTMEQ